MRGAWAPVALDGRPARIGYLSRVMFNPDVSGAPPAFISQRISAPGEWLLALHERWPERYPALLESAARSQTLGRFDLLLACPEETLRFERPGELLAALDSRCASASHAQRDLELPFTGGWLIFVGYEVAAGIEHRLALPASPDPFAALALRVPAAIVRDRVRRRSYLVAEASRADHIGRMQRDLASLADAPAGSRVPECPISGRLTEEPPARFIEGVHRVQEYIAAGDVYQVNLSRGWRLDLAAGDPPAAATLYRALRRANPAPFAASFVHEDWALISSSPERLFKVRAGEIVTRPIAGTRPRRRRGSEAHERAALHAHPKERAEHVMLVDLERNDLGRICIPGSVEVEEFLALETYAHVHHLVSSVRGRLRAGVGPGAVLRALFPGGTITGCPKVRCMQIIAELEGAGRGAYTGSLGYLNHDGSGEFNILIRTLTYQRSRGEVRFRAGAGIVADSDPQQELEETRAKARGLLRAFELRR